MGMYTQIALGIQLKEDTPKDVIDVLKFMTSEQDYSPHANLKGEEAYQFFRCDRWAFTLRCDSYYFDWQTRFHLDRDDLHGTENPPMWFLTGCSNLKNYDGEIGKFMLWLAPYIYTDGFLGFTMYEEDLVPTLIYKWEDGIIQNFQPTGAPNR